MALARDGRQAFAAVRQHPPDLILLDILMPVMNGLEFLEACRQAPECKKVPVVAISAAMDLRQIASGPQVKAALAKPFDLTALLGMVARLTQAGEQSAVGAFH